MVGVALFGHEHSIHAHVNISKDGVAKIVDAVGVRGIVYLFYFLFYFYYFPQ